MTYVFAIIAAMLAAVLGWFITGAIAVVVAGWCGMSDFEGGRGMFAFLFVGPLGGLLAMVGSAWAVLRRGEGRVSKGPILARLGAVLAAVAVVIGAAIWIRLATLDTYTDRLPPRLEFEIRVPDGALAADSPPPRVELHTDKNVGEGQLFDTWEVTEDGHRVIAGSVSLDFKTRSRLLAVTLPEQPARLFRLPLPRDPESSPGLGEWRHADHVDLPGSPQPQPPPPGDPVEIRYRVRHAGED